MFPYIISLVIVIIIMSAVIYVFSDVFRESGRKMKRDVLSQRKQSLDRLYRISFDNRKKALQHDKSKIKDFNRHMEQLILKADVKITLAEFFGITIMFGVCGWLVGSIFNNIVIEIIIALVFALIPRNYFSFIADLHKKKIHEQLEPVLSQIINLLPTKKTLINACESIVHTMEEPLKTFFVEFINNINNANRSFDEALHELARKVDCKQFYDFERLALIHYRQGGDTVYAFSSIPENIRDMKLVQSEQEAELDSLRAVGYLFVFCTPLCLIYYLLAKKEYFDVLVNTMFGKILMLVIVFNTILTVFLTKKISKPVDM